MKKPILLLSFCTILAFLQPANAQDDNLTPHGGAAKILLLDHGVPNGVDTLGVTNGLELSYFRVLNDWANLSVPLKISVADIAGSPNNSTLFGLDAIVQFPVLRNKSRLAPYVFAGAGFVIENLEESNIQFPIGVGGNVALGRNSFITFQGEYRKATQENRNNLQFGLGYMFRISKQMINKNTDRDGDGVADASDNCPDEPGSITASGCPDSDGDGITNANDNCPDEPGPISANGCPDMDGDGIADKFDDCPEVKGFPATKGCPTADKDGDGIPDEKDDCPDQPGPRETEGCPDSDGDGVADKYDLCNGEPGIKYTSGCPDRDSDGIADKFDDCPDLAGPPERKGCPMIDKDGDGVIDTQDDCPTQKGPASSNGCPDTDGDGLHDGIDRCPNGSGPAKNGGCPEISQEIKDILALATSNVQFETGASTLLASSYPILDQIVAILKKYPGYKLRITGHTDDVGTEENNQKLSEARTKTCFEYFQSKGIAGERMSYQGFGESRPIASNLTPEGRALNRRVQFELVLE